MNWTTQNIFQRLVRQWDALHPYNAAQVIHLSGTPCADALDESWRRCLAELGLGRICTSGHRYRFECLNGDGSTLRVQRFNSDSTLPRVVGSELNRRFDPSEDLPLRPFVLPAQEGFFLGVIYHHWVGDSASIRLLLREWFYRLYDPSRARARPIRVAQNGYWRSFGPTRGRWRLGRGVLDSLRWSSRMRRVRRVERADFDNYRTHFSLHHLPNGAVDALCVAARRSGATLNDVFLATAAEVADRFSLVTATPRRQDLAVGTIIDLRSRGRADLSDVFGLYLGFTSVVCRPRDLREWDRLLQRVAIQTRMHKDNGVPEASMIRIAAGLAAHRLLSTSGVKQFYRKRLPLAGGVSNVNLNDTWVRDYHPAPILDYIRVSPCGPIMPLVFTPTTVGNRLNFGLTCRESVVPPERVAAVADAFRQRLERFAADGA